MTQRDTTNSATKNKKVTLGDVFKRKNLEVLTYIDKTVLVDEEVVFCVTECKKISVPNSKFDIPEQWQLTIATPVKDGSVRKYWLTFIPNEVRDDFMTAIQEALEEAHTNGLQAVHSCKLQRINLSEGRVNYPINFTEETCSCGLDE